MWCSEDGARLSESAVDHAVGQLGDREVQQLYVVLATPLEHKDVLWLQVAMDDVRVVNALQRGGDLCTDASDSPVRNLTTCL